MAFSAQKREHHIRYAQNFVKDPQLITKLLEQTDIKFDSVILEIGGGKGTITKALSRLARQVITIEKDPELAKELKQQFANSNVTVIEQDALKAKSFLPTEPFSIFANPPFNVTSAIVKTCITFAKNQPESFYLFMQKEAAQRFAGIPHEYETSLQLKPWYDVNIAHTFQPQDFAPQPNVHVVLLAGTKKEAFDLSSKQQSEWLRLLQAIHAQNKETAQKCFEPLLTLTQWKRLAQDVQFHPKAKLRELSYTHWLAIFQYIQVGVSQEKRTDFLGDY